MPEDGRGLVLVVEDDRAIADLVERYLRRDGFGVHVESDGAAGLGAVRRLRTWSRIFVALFGIALAVSTTLMVAAVSVPLKPPPMMAMFTRRD